MTNVRAYTDKELFDKIKSLDTFQYIPTNYWIIGVQSQEDEFNTFDDKFYLYRGEKFIHTMSGTTNAGTDALKGYDKAGLSGAAVWKTNMIYYDLFTPGKHKGKMDALRQAKPIYYYRDKNKDDKADEVGELHHGIIGANFHTNSYDPNSRAIKKLIGAWSYGCQVINDGEKYYKTLELTKAQKFITYAILKEF